MPYQKHIHAAHVQPLVEHIPGTDSKYAGRGPASMLGNIFWDDYVMPAFIRFLKKYHSLDVMGGRSIPKNACIHPYAPSKWYLEKGVDIGMSEHVVKALEKLRDKAFHYGNAVSGNSKLPVVRGAKVLSINGDEGKVLRQIKKFLRRYFRAVLFYSNADGAYGRKFITIFTPETEILDYLHNRSKKCHAIVIIPTVYEIDAPGMGVAKGKILYPNGQISLLDWSGTAGCYFPYEGIWGIQRFTLIPRMMRIMKKAVTYVESQGLDVRYLDYWNVDFIRYHSLWRYLYLGIGILYPGLKTTEINSRMTYGALTGYAALKNAISAGHLPATTDPADFLYHISRGEPYGGFYWAVMTNDQVAPHGAHSFQDVVRRLGEGSYYSSKTVAGEPGWFFMRQGYNDLHSGFRIGLGFAVRVSVNEGTAKDALRLCAQMYIKTLNRLGCYQGEVNHLK